MVVLHVEILVLGGACQCVACACGCDLCVLWESRT